MIPANGIYACWAYLNGKRHRAAINIGINPTFTPDKQIPNVEAHILDFDREIYGEDVRLEFVARLRDELKFDSGGYIGGTDLEGCGRDKEKILNV